MRAERVSSTPTARTIPAPSSGKSVPGNLDTCPAISPEKRQFLQKTGRRLHEPRRLFAINRRLRRPERSSLKLSAEMSPNLSPAWVQLKKEKWLPISRKRHQIGHLDFRSFRLLTEGLLVRI